MIPSKQEIAPIDQGAEMRAAFMSIANGFNDHFGGYDACSIQRSTWESWRM